MKRTVLLIVLIFTLINSSLHAQYGFEDAIRKAQEKKIMGKLSKMKFSYTLLITPNDTIKCRRTDQNELNKLISVGGEIGTGGTYLSLLEKDLEQCRQTVEERKVLTYTGNCESNMRNIKYHLSTFDLTDYEKELSFYNSIEGKHYVMGILPTDYLNDGNYEYDRNNFTAAFTFFSGYLKTNPKDSSVLKKRGFSGLKVLENEKINDSRYLDSTLLDYNSLIFDFGIKRYYLNLGIAYFYGGDNYMYGNPKKSIDNFNQALESITNYELEFGRSELSREYRQKSENALKESESNLRKLSNYQSLVKDVNANIDKLNLTEQVKTDLIIQIKTLDRMIQKDFKYDILNQSSAAEELLNEMQIILENINDNILYSNISKESLSVFGDFQTKNQREKEDAQQAFDERARQEAAEIQNRQSVESKQEVKNVKRESLIQKYGEKYGSLIADKKVAIGMTKEMCIAAWGKPHDINKTTNSYGVREQWVYGLKTYLYFDDELLTTVQN